MARSQFGSVRKLPSGRYQAGYWHEGRRHTASATFRTKTDATTWLSAQRTDINRGQWVQPTAGQITFRTYAEQWRKMQVHRDGTAKQVESHLRLHVYPRIGDRRLSAIRHSDIQALVKNLADTLAPATVEVVYTWVSTIFGAAVADRRITVSPCREGRIRRPEVHRPPVQPLSVDTVYALIDGIAPRYRALVILGAGAGVRMAEALGLTDDRVDWLGRRVTIDRQLTRVRTEDGQPVWGPVKDHRNRPRTIPVPSNVIDALSEHVACYGRGPDGLIFTGPHGGPLRHTTFSDAWRAVAGPLGVPLGDGYHELRHFYASTLIRAGESVKVVQERLGHTSAQMTLDVYGHLWPEDEESTRRAVADALSGISGPAGGTLRSARARIAHGYRLEARSP